jgi:hypothetical protein
MQLDPHKPYGLVMNHSRVRYEQDGKRFDFAGKLLTGDDEDEPAADNDTVTPAKALEPGERDFGLEQAKEFLRNVLAEGPLRRAEIFKVCEANNQPWETVKTAFAAIEGQVHTRKNSLYWQLKQE